MYEKRNNDKAEKTNVTALTGRVTDVETAVASKVGAWKVATTINITGVGSHYINNINVGKNVTEFLVAFAGADWGDEQPTPINIPVISFRPSIGSSWQYFNSDNSRIGYFELDSNIENAGTVDFLINFTRDVLAPDPTNAKVLLLYR